MTSLKTSEYFMGWEQNDNMIVGRISHKLLSDKDYTVNVQYTVNISILILINVRM
jgi:hypothetical protein